MNDNEVLNIILDEQKFPCENMTKEERNYYLNILKSCKDICDTKYKVDKESKCEIVRMKFVKTGNTVGVDGMMKIGSESRTLNAIIFPENNAMVVDMQVTRYLDDGPKVYDVLEEFYIENDKLVRKTEYNYDEDFMHAEINNEEMRGRLR